MNLCTASTTNDRNIYRKDKGEYYNNIICRESNPNLPIHSPARYLYANAAGPISRKRNGESLNKFYIIWNG